MRWHVYQFERLIRKLVWFRHGRTHWWAAPLYQKQRSWHGLINWLDCFDWRYTSSFNLCTTAGQYQFQSPSWSRFWEGIQWVSRGKQYLPLFRLSLNFVTSETGLGFWRRTGDAYSNWINLPPWTDYPASSFPPWNCPITLSDINSTFPPRTTVSITRDQGSSFTSTVLANRQS